MNTINKQNFKQDFNNNVLTNEQLFKKYGFTNSKDLCNYAKDNNLINKPNELTAEEKRNLKALGDWMTQEGFN